MKITETELSVVSFVNATENPEKVMLAISNIFGDLDYNTENRENGLRIYGTNRGISSLSLLREIIARMRIRDASRSFLERIAQDNFLSFGLNKQAAYAGAISFHQEGDSPLGPIQVTIRGDTLEIIDYLCGKPPIPLF